MILQRDPNLRKEIREYGCYFMDLLWYGNKIATTPLDQVTIDTEIYPWVIKHDWMNSECYIKNPSMILQYVGVPNTYLGHMPKNYECSEDEIEISRWVYENLSHFVASENGVVTYDPWGISKCAAKGRLESKRVFRILGGLNA